MGEKIEITEKVVRKSAGQEKAFVDMLNQEVKELQTNMETANLENELSNIQTYSYMDIYPCRQKQSNRIVAEHLIMKGYRKESDTAREILNDIITGFVFGWKADNEDYRNGYEQALTDYDEKIKNYIKEKYGV